MRNQSGDDDMNSAKKNVTFRNMDHSAVINDHVHKQFERLEKFLEQERTPISIDMIIEAKPIHSHHIVELRINTPHFHEIVKDEGSDIYLVIDSVINAMCTLLSRDKKRMIDERKNNKKPSVID